MNKYGIFDSHVHLDDEKFANDREELIEALPSLGVTRMVNIGADMVSSKNSLELANKYDYIYAAVGVHPHETKDMTEDDIKTLGSYIETDKKTVAVGEIGLDYHYDNSARDVQQMWFKRQMELAKDTGMPVILHIRDAWDDAMQILKYFGKMPANGVVHCFSGSVETAREVLKLGYKLGIGGVVTFTNAKKLVEVTAEIPLDEILLETDCPYMAPVPHRGERNNPAYALLAAQKIAQIKNITTETVIKTTYDNANSFFGISE